MMTYLNIGRMGRFANAMFEIAGTIGIAVQSGQSFAFPQWVNHDAVERFGTTEDIYLYKHFKNPLPELPHHFDFKEYEYFWGYRYINLPSGDWNFNAHFQSEKYFLHCKDLIRYYFTMTNEPLDIDATAVHMRFGDYDGSYHPRPDIEYYRQALVQVPGPYLLFSDDLDAAQRIMSELKVQYVPIEKDYIESFKIMKHCKHFICGNSSYSMMAAILADQKGKIITAPKKWFGDHVGLETVDLYPEGTIII